MARIAVHLKSGPALLSSAAIVALICGNAPAALAQAATTDSGQAEEDVTSGQQDRSVIFSVPVLRSGNPLGEIQILVEPSGRVEVDGNSLFAIIEPLLSDTGKERYRASIDGAQFFAPEIVSDAGIDVVFDSSQLELRIVSIDPDIQNSIGIGSDRNRTDQLPPTIAPADFSAYLNLGGSLDYLEGSAGSELRNPEIIGFGAARAGDFGLLYEGGLTNRPDDSYGPYRRFVRAIYDIEPKSLRLSGGDIQATSLPILGSPLLGGVGVERRRRIFDPFDPVFRIGGRRLRIDSPSTIEIVNNGTVLRTIPVDQGIYDLEELPLIFGANNVDIVIRDAAGRTSVTNFSYFFDPVDLEVGDYEYGVYAGLVSAVDSLEPSYGSEVGMTAFYRKAFSPSLLAGAAFQGSQDVQAAAGELRWAPQVIPGVVESQAAISNSDDGIGFGARIGYRWVQALSAGNQQATVLFDYESANYRIVGLPVFLNESRLGITATYGRSLTPRTFLSSGLNYFKRGDEAGRLNVFGDVLHQFTPRLRGTLGVEYGRNDGFGDGFGVRVGLTLLFGENSRADANYESRRETFRAGASRGLENRVGAIGYDVNVEQGDGRSFADAALQYRANRFDSRLLVTGTGEGFGNIGDDRRAQLQMSTSIAYADGTLGVGRTITDGFAIVTPHPRIEAEAIVGNDLNNGEYQGRSGLLGGAIVPDILGYQNREVLYDIDTTNTVFDVGDGTDRVRVATGGGARIVVGNARFVSAIGTLVTPGGPVSLMSGSIYSDTDAGFQPLQFFTNSVGRFAAIGLAPGEEYRVLLRDGREFAFVVPDSNEGLLRLETVTIEESAE